MTNLTRKDKHVNFAGGYDELKTKQLLSQTTVYKIYLGLTRFH